MIWRRLSADGCDWEVRVLPYEAETADANEEEILEFRPLEATRPPRRLAVSAGRLDEMNEADLQAAYLRARPIGADFYGRPGKRMSDMR